MPDLSINTSDMSLSRTEVLLLDDNEIQLSTRQTILKRAGFYVETSRTPEQALQLIADTPQRFGLIVTDHFMPGMSGADFVAALRNYTQDVPVLVISGQSDVEHEYSGMSVAFEAKPCSPEMFIRRVTEALSNGLRRTA